MNCKNIYFLYNKENECILLDIELDIREKCKNCIYTETDEEYLNQKKAEQIL